jgi:hypothetical protein
MHKKDGGWMKIIKGREKENVGERCGKVKRGEDEGIQGTRLCRMKMKGEMKKRG